MKNKVTGSDKDEREDGVEENEDEQKSENKFNLDLKAIEDQLRTGALWAKGKCN
jgi:hypothetical protein